MGTELLPNLLFWIVEIIIFKFYLASEVDIAKGTTQKKLPKACQ